MTQFKLTPTETRQGIMDCMEARLVPFVQSSPGLGKSSIVRQIAKDYDFELIDVRLSQCAPEDLMGLPMRRGEGDQARAFFAPFETFPLAGQPLPPGKRGWILFLDEFNSASKSVQAAAYKPVLDHMVGQAHLHEDCFIVAAGNLSTDRAIVTQMGTAMQSRVVHIEMVVDHKETLKYAFRKNWDHRILGFLEFQPGKLHHFNPDHQDRTFACPRTWEFASLLCKDKPLEKVSLPLLAGTLSDGVAVELHSFMKEYSNLPTYRKICEEADTLAVPHSASTCYALVTSMMSQFTEQSFSQAVRFVRRLSPEFQVVYFRGVVAQHPKMRTNPDYVRNITHLVKFLNEDETAQAA
tara:strand:- start:23360 stop:24415 length:1056 start_codon:yes stop_codon:yes gene_type:complete